MYSFNAEKLEYAVLSVRRFLDVDGGNRKIGFFKSCKNQTC